MTQEMTPGYALRDVLGQSIKFIGIHDARLHRRSALNGRSAALFRLSKPS
jgi:hypothetical protein